MRVKLNSFLSGACTLAILVAAQPAMAQDDRSLNISDEDIIVTARFRNETLQDVPQAISAFDTRVLQNVAARDITDLGPSTPNVIIQPVATFSNSASIYMRGIGGQDIESTVESPVGISIDGVIVTRPVATMLDTFDLERIEVLRGPQGTSFGKNSLAGGIAAHTKNPTGEWGGKAEITVGNYGRFDARASLDVPLAEDVLAARLYVGREHYNGFFTNRVNEKKIGGQNRLSMRGTLLATPSDAVEVNLKMFFVRDRSSAPGGDSAPDRTKLLYTLIGFEEPNDGAFRIGRDFPGSHDTDQFGVIGNISINLAEAWALKSVTGYIETDDFNDSDFDHSEIPFFPTFRLQSHRQFSQELRLQSDFSGRDDALARLNLVLGGYFLRQSFEMTQAFPTLPSAAMGSQDYVAQKNDAYALFAQAIYGITDRLNMTFGIRQSWEEKEYLRDPVGTFITPGGFNTRDKVIALDAMKAIVRDNLANDAAFELGYKRDRMTFKGGLDYKLTDDVMIYGAYAQGYKGGGFGARSAAPFTAGPTKDNRSEMFELGMKGDFFDRLLRLNLTGFITKYKDLEFGVFIPNPDVSSGQETMQSNIGKATAKGIELEATLRPTQNLRLHANIGYLDAKYTDFCVDLDGPSAYSSTPTSECGDVTNFGGNIYTVDEDFTHLSMVRTPKWQTQLAAEYSAPLGDAGSLNFRLAGNYSSHYVNSITDVAWGRTGDFVLLDGSIGWESDNGKYRLQLWGKNLTKRTYVTAITPTADYFIQRFYGAPRTFGLTLGAGF